MRRFSFIIGIFCGVLMICDSCVRDVVMDANEKPKVAVGCILTEEPIQKLYLCFTKGASVSAAQPL